MPILQNLKLIKYISSKPHQYGNFVDFKVISLYGGNGGDGACSFFRDNRTSFGRPNGGDGGSGGDVVFVADENQRSLSHLHSSYKALDGRNGMGSDMHGRAGKPLKITVPVGTVIRKIKPLTTNKNESNNLDKYSQYYRTYPGKQKSPGKIVFPYPRMHKSHEVLEFDMNTHNQEVVIVKGGAGGKGNPYFSSNFINQPYISERGLIGENYKIELELKSIADAGLLGLPNAGKSTFLGAVSNCHPKIADYPFTTLNPFLGTIDFKQEHFQLVTADIPGIIKGAHLNRGLGHSFLRHIERCKILVYVIDVCSADPVTDFKILHEEIGLYKQELVSKPALIIANKADLPGSYSNYQSLEKFTNLPTVPISAKFAQNITKATKLMKDLVLKNQNL